MRIEAEGAMTGGAPNMIRPMPGNGRPRVVILGAGFGGLAAAMALKCMQVDITVIDRRNYHLFQPLLYRWRLQAYPPRKSRCRSAASCRARRM